MTSNLGGCIRLASLKVREVKIVFQFKADESVEILANMVFMYQW